MPTRYELFKQTLAENPFLRFSTGMFVLSGITLISTPIAGTYAGSEVVPTMLVSSISTMMGSVLITAAYFCRKNHKRTHEAVNNPAPEPGSPPSPLSVVGLTTPPPSPRTPESPSSCASTIEAPDITSEVEKLKKCGKI